MMVFCSCYRKWGVESSHEKVVATTMCTVLEAASGFLEFSPLQSTAKTQTHKQAIARGPSSEGLRAWVICGLKCRPSELIVDGGGVAAASCRRV